MKRENKRYLVFPIILVMLVVVMSSSMSCAKATGTLSVFAAAGAKAPLDEISQQFQVKYGTAIEISYGGGGEVLNQMVISKSGDIYVAPEQSFMDSAVAQGAVDAATIKSVAYMIPVIAVKKGNPLNILTLADLARPGVRIAIGRAETTLLGKLAPQMFGKAGLSGEIEKNILTTASDCQSMLTMLVMGSIDAAILWNFYGTSAADKVDVVFLPPEQLTGIGEIQMAVTTYCQNEKSAQQFIDFMASDSSQGIFKKYGYLVSSEEVSQYWH
jgi:molybdate transport system substrate-binding protein